MKKVLFSILSLVFIFTLTACQSVPLADYTSEEILRMVYNSETVQNGTKEFATEMGFETLDIDVLTEGFFVLDSIPSSQEFGLPLEGLDVTSIESGTSMSMMLTMMLYTDFVIKVNDPEQIDSVVSFLETYQENVWAYPHDEETKMNAKVVVNGNTVALFLNPNYELFEEAFLGLE
jgi:hypothetical protein